MTDTIFFETGYLAIARRIRSAQDAEEKDLLTNQAETYRSAINDCTGVERSHKELLAWCLEREKNREAERQRQEEEEIESRRRFRILQKRKSSYKEEVENIGWLHCWFADMTDDEFTEYLSRLRKTPTKSNEKLASIQPKLQDIQNYTAPPESHLYQKQLHAFLLKDTISENEDLFEALEPLISEFRRERNVCETNAERKFLIAYRATLLRNGIFNEGFFKGTYKLEPQKEIEGSIAKVKPYRADFLNEKTKVIVEINGSVHDTDEQRKYDRNRTRELFNLGYLVLNFTNDEIEQNAYKCAREVMTAIEKQLKGATTS